MRSIISVALLSLALFSVGCSHMGHRGGCCGKMEEGKCAADCKEHKDGCCKSGECDMKKTEATK